jgi:hypothetical protein
MSRASTLRWKVSWEGQATVADAGSANGTFVNGARVSGWAPLPPGAGVGTGIVVALATHEKAMLLISLLGLILPIVVSAIENNQRKERRNAFAYAARNAQGKIAWHVTKEGRVRHLLAPGPAEIMQMATRQRPDLWPRGVHSPNGQLSLAPFSAGSMFRPAAVGRGLGRRARCRCTR